MSRSYQVCRTVPERPGPAGFGYRLSRLRHEQRIQAKALARILRVSNGMVRHWELGEGYPSFWSLMEIARFFNVDLNWLTGHTVLESKDDTANPPQTQVRQSRVQQAA